MDRKLFLTLLSERLEELKVGNHNDGRSTSRRILDRNGSYHLEIGIKY